MEMDEINARIEELKRRFNRLVEESWPCRVSKETVMQYAKEFDRLEALKSVKAI